MIGRAIAQYKILDKLGAGGMGSVFRGVDTMLDRPVAIKVLRAHTALEPEVVERFRAEAALLAKLNHINIPTLYSFFREGDEFFMAMELIHGVPISEWARRDSPLTPKQAAELMIQVLAGLEHAHELGIVHRDIKPANLLVTEQGIVKITDFGIGRALGSARLTREARLVGTIEYLAPERIKGEAGDVRSDIYSAGAVLYELLTNRIPFERENDLELMRAHLEVQPIAVRQFCPDVPEQLERIVGQALAKKPAERFATAEHMRTALTAIAWTSGVPATRHAGQLSKPPDFVFNQRVSFGKRTWIGIACGAALLAALLFVASRNRDSRRTPVHSAEPNSAIGAADSLSRVPAVAPAPSSSPTAAASSDTSTISRDGSADDEDARKKKEAERARRRAAALRALDE